MLLTHIRRGVMPYYVTWGRRYRHYGRGERILYYGGGIFFLWWIGSMMCATVVCEAGWPPPSYFWTLLLWPLALLEKLHHYVIS